MFAQKFIQPPTIKSRMIFRSIIGIKIEVEINFFAAEIHFDSSSVKIVRDAFSRVQKSSFRNPVVESIDYGKFELAEFSLSISTASKTLFVRSRIKLYKSSFIVFTSNFSNRLPPVEYLPWNYNTGKTPAVPKIRL